MRDNGVSEFPDPDASGELTIDGIANGSSLDTNSAAFKQAISACKDLEPSGFTGHKRSAEKQETALKFAQCIRDNGVEDFPDPTPDAPLVDTTRIPSTDRDGGMSILNAAMQKCGAAFVRQAGGHAPVKRKTWVLAAAAVLVVVAVIVGVVVLSVLITRPRPRRRRRRTRRRCDRGSSRPMVSQDGTLTYRARPDGSPYSVINQARGTYTRLPAAGDKVDCGDVLYRVDEHPVLLLCGTVPAYRDLDVGDVGNDVRQLNRNLHELGYDAKAHVHIWPADDDFTVKTEKALEVLQRDKGVDVTGALAIGDAVFLPEAVRIAKVTGELGGSARPGAPVLSATPTRCTCRSTSTRRSRARSSRATARRSRCPATRR